MVATVLMVAEKPSLAESIASILSSKQHKTSPGIGTPVHEWGGKFQNQAARFRMTSVAGHIYTLDFPKEFNNWDSVTPDKLFTAPTVKIESSGAGKIVRHIGEESKKADFLVLWLDCDREGENICFEVIKVAIGLRGKKDNIFRARFSGISSNDINKAMNSLTKPNENEAKAVDARQELDLKIGCAFTRFQTRYFQGKYGDLDANVISYGPCQTPTLAFCINRHDEILRFIPQPYWTVSVEINHGKIIRLHSQQGRMFKKEQAMQLEAQLKGIEHATVIAVKSSTKHKSGPIGLNTVELLKVASRSLGISPQETMNLAERLYIQGFISYPRTETTKYAKDFDFNDALTKLANNRVWADDVQKVRSLGFKRPEGGVDVGDHPPIVPLSSVGCEHLSGNLGRIYDYVVQHFLGSIAPTMQYLQQDVTFQVGTQTMSCTVRKILRKGFAEFMSWMLSAFEEEDQMGSNEFSENDSTYPISRVILKQDETSPPDYLTESELLGLMEKHGIGTDASMATFVNLISQRNYVTVTGNKRTLVPTNLGILLIHGYKKIDPDLCLPTMRSDMEKQIVLIANGKARMQDVLQSMTNVFLGKFNYFVQNIENMNQLFEATFSPLASTGKPFSKCGRCRRYMNLIEFKPPRLHCKTCNETYSLPTQGSIRLYKELKCPLDDFELVMITFGTKSKGYPLCPSCYSVPPEILTAQGAKAPMSCSNCPNQLCPYSQPSNFVTMCSNEKCTGQLILDATSAPHWKLSCNSCVLVANFADAINLVAISSVKCDCESKKVTLSFKEKGKESITGCIWCDDSISNLMDAKLSVISQRRGRKGRGRGRGRGRGNRGGMGSGRRRGDDSEDERWDKRSIASEYLAKPIEKEFSLLSLLPSGTFLPTIPTQSYSEHLIQMDQEPSRSISTSPAVIKSKAIHSRFENSQQSQVADSSPRGKAYGKKKSNEMERSNEGSSKVTNKQNSHRGTLKNVKKTLAIASKNDSSQPTTTQFSTLKNIASREEQRSRPNTLGEEEDKKHDVIQRGRGQFSHRRRGQGQGRGQLLNVQ